MSLVDSHRSYGTKIVVEKQVFLKDFHTQSRPGSLVIEGCGSNVGSMSV